MESKLLSMKPLFANSLSLLGKGGELLGCLSGGLSPWRRRVCRLGRSRRGGGGWIRCCGLVFLVRRGWKGGLGVGVGMGRWGRSIYRVGSQYETSKGSEFAKDRSSSEKMGDGILFGSRVLAQG